ncbi:MAG: ferredoxin [Alphaproteobacteria bacterium]|nr:ferredoxin [Alphaproteobacteria bacterium]
MTVMKVKVDYRKCLKAGECYYNHPTLFQRTENGLPKILAEEVTSDSQRREAEEAVEVCPAGAISLEE